MVDWCRSAFGNDDAVKNPLDIELEIGGCVGAGAVLGMVVVVLIWLVTRLVMWLR